MKSTFVEKDREKMRNTFTFSGRMLALNMQAVKFSVLGMPERVKEIRERVDQLYESPELLPNTNKDERQGG